MGERLSSTPKTAKTSGDITKKWGEEAVDRNY